MQVYITININKSANVCLFLFLCFLVTLRRKADVVAIIF